MMTAGISTKLLQKYFFILTIGVLINVSAYVGVLSLQTSVNIQKNLGAISASVLNISAAILCLFATPVLFKRFKAKWCLVIGETSFIFYSLANIYPTFYTMIPGALMGSFGEAFIWSAGPLYVNHIVEEMWKNLDENRPTLDYLRNKWLGYFYFVIKSCMIWGNVISYATLYGGRHLNIENTLNKTSNSNVITCGSSMCQKSNFTEDLHKFVPTSKTSLYITFGVYVAIQIISVVIHFCFLPTNVHEEEEVQHEKHPMGLLLSTLQSTVKHMISRDQVLLSPLTFYYGYYVGFVYPVFTQAFISCTIGVQQVGLVMSCYGIGNCFSSITFGWVSHKFGITPVVGFGFFYDMCGYTILLLWKPTLENSYWLYIIGAYMGVTDGIWQLSVVSIVSRYFQDRKEVAFGVVSLLTVLGIFLGFVLAATICVERHTYSLIGTLIISCCGYAIAETLRKYGSYSGTERETENILRED